MIKQFLNWAGKKLMLLSLENLNELSYLERKIANWLHSPQRLEQLTGDRYYCGDHDILQKKRTGIGENGEQVELKRLPNNRKVDNQYAKMVDQKTNYLLSQPLAFKSENEEYVKQLTKVFNKRFHKILKNIGEDCMNGGIAWLHPYYNELGEMKFKRFAAYEILPFWADDEHTELAMAVRYYLEEDPNRVERYIQKIEVYTKNGIDFYTFENNRLHPDVSKPHQNYFRVGEQDYNWERIPLIAFKLNSKEIPLIKRCKNLQDSINEIVSTFKNNMEENAYNTILILENYEGEDLAEFRYNVNQYGVIKVGSIDGARGDVRTLQIEVNAQNYESILKIFKKALLENCKGYDFTDLHTSGGEPNQMLVKSIFSEIDLDANEMELEFQCAFEELLFFVNHSLSVVDEEVEIIFNRDVLQNEAEIIQMLASVGLRVSNRTLISQVPFVDDIDAEEAQLEKEEEKQMDAYDGAVPMKGGKPNVKK